MNVALNKFTRRMAMVWYYQGNKRQALPGKFNINCNLFQLQVVSSCVHIKREMHKNGVFIYIESFSLSTCLSYTCVCASVCIKTALKGVLFKNNCIFQFKIHCRAAYLRNTATVSFEVRTK